MKNFFQSSVWQSRIKGDVLLHQAANASLDLTIERLGRTLVSKELAAYRHAMKVTRTLCGTAVFPCNTSGMHQDSTDSCFMDSIGCGYKCLDKLSLEST